MKPPFDLVILDLDGTILNLYRAEQVSPTVCATIAAVQAAGIPVTIGTGRTLDYVRTNLADLLQLKVPVVSTQGAVVGDPVSGRMLTETTIPLEAARQVAQWVEVARPITVFYFNEPDGYTRLYQTYFAEDPEDLAFHEHVFGAPRIPLPSFLPKLAGPHAHPPVKFLIDNNLHRSLDLAPELQARFGNDLYITRTHPRLIEGTARGVNKGQGVLDLCRLLGIDPQRVLAIGDNDNDIPMLEVVGYGVAMGNATPGVKAVAQWIAPTIEEDGVAVALQRLVLDKRGEG
jgi:Cof subfamily protein (haloacid dehalogenase superfamily)